MLDDGDDDRPRLLHGDRGDRDLRRRGRRRWLAREERLGETGESPRKSQRRPHAPGGNEPDQPEGAIAAVPLAGFHHSFGDGDPDGLGDWEGLGDCGGLGDWVGLAVGFAVGSVRRTGGGEA